MKLIAGLGNPGKNYENTPHNVGFRVIDLLDERLDAGLKKSSKMNGDVGSARYKDTDLMLVKPTTFMNNSGLSVQAVMRYRKLTPADVMVVVDDADLPLGTLRIRARGSSGGHNGLKSISSHLGTDDYLRIRFGVGRSVGEGKSLAGYVLRPFLESERASVEETVVRAADAVLAIIDDGIESAMNAFNGTGRED